MADLKLLGIALAAIVATWLLLGWSVTGAITQGDGNVLVVPYTDSALHAGTDWTDHLYRFGVVGGSKMHEFAGTLPLVQLCSLLGLSTTLTVNLTTFFLQLCFAFFGLKSIEALTSSSLTWPQRIVTIWICGFAPVLGWRLAIGHENLLIGLLPLVATISLLWSSRTARPSVTALLFAAFAVANGVSGLGPQTVIYSVVFGLPLFVATIAMLRAAPRGSRWGISQWVVVGAVVAGVLVALPRLVGMIDHALGDDASRSLGEAVTYSYGAASWTDWLGSLAWTRQVAPVADAHEHNFPIGPVVSFVIASWSVRPSRRLVWGLVTGGVLAMLFATNTAPISTWLVDLVPPLGAFRVPARAILPIVVFVPPLALAAVWSRSADLPRLPARSHWLAFTGAVFVILVGRKLGPWPRELAAWAGCLGIAGCIRFGAAQLAARALAIGLPIVAALGVCAFDERFPRDLGRDRIEDGPRALREAVLAQAPEIAMPLARVEVVDTTQPYDMSTAFAARLPSLDGVWYPPRRFLVLLGALSGTPLPSTTCVFDVSHSQWFPALQQLYNVRYIVSPKRGSIDPLPEPPGAAWFPRQIERVATPRDMVLAWSGHDLHAELRRAAWLVAGDFVPAFDVSPDCATAHVTGVTTDELGQTATIEVSSTATCPLVVATNYATTLRATALVAGTSQPAPVFPTDVALTGILVPAGARTITLGPVADIPTWSRLAQLLGFLVLALCAGHPLLSRLRSRA